MLLVTLVFILISAFVNSVASTELVSPEILDIMDGDVVSTSQKILHIPSTDVKMKLTQAEVPFAKDFFIIRSSSDGSGGVEVVKDIDVGDLEGRLFVNRREHTSVAVRRLEDGSHLVSGVLGKDYAIRPSKMNNIRKRNAHHLEKIKGEESSGYTNDYIKVEEVLQKRSISEEVAIESNCLVIEMLVVIDYEYQKHFKNQNETIEYMACYINSVNIRYATVFKAIGLKIRVVLTGIIVNDSPAMEPYIGKEKDGIDLPTILPNFSNYTRENYPELKYDLGFLLTAKMTSPYLINGMAWYLSCCRPSHRYFFVSETYPLSYDRIGTTVHEIGHQLGLVHDGLNYSSTPGAPSAEACEDYKYIMGAPSQVNGGFSNCSLKQLEYFSKLPQLNCLKTMDNSVFNISSSALPGEKLDATEMCHKHFQTSSDEDVSGVIIKDQCKINCTLIWGGYTFNRIENALDGHECGDGKICWIGDCVAKDTVAVPSDLCSSSFDDDDS